MPGPSQPRTNTGPGHGAGDTPVPDEVHTARVALASLGPAEDGHLSQLDVLASRLMSRFKHSGDTDDLDEAIARTRHVLDLAPHGHALRITALANIAQWLFTRFKLHSEASDLAQATDYFEATMQLSTPKQSFYIHVVAGLSNCLLNRYRRNGDVADLDRIVGNSSTALSACSPESPGRDVLFSTWATALKERFNNRGNRSDLDAALVHYQTCLDLRPPGHPSRHIALGNLADAMVFRFEVDGHLKDLESAASHYQSALQSCSPGQDGFPTLLMSLGIACIRLYHAQGDADKLGMAIGYYQTAMSYSTVPNLAHSCLLDNYAAALQSRYRLYGNVSDLDQAIQYLTASSDIVPSTYSGLPNTLSCLGTAFLDRFNMTSKIADLDVSIEKFTSALQLCAPGYHQRHSLLSLYAHALLARFKANGDERDLDLAVSTCKDALANASPKEFSYLSTVANLCLILHDAFFFQSGNVEDFQTVIDYCDRALASTSSTESAFALQIVRAKSFLQKALLERKETAIDTSIDAFREVIRVLPDGHGESVRVRLQLGLALDTRFQLSGNTTDLDESISVYRLAHRICRRESLDYVQACMNLGNALRESFECHLGSGDALDEAIVLLAQVHDILSATPRHADYRPLLANLAIALFYRFQAQMTRKDLDSAIEYLSRALALPAASEGYLVQHTLATCLSVRYDEYSDLDDLEQSVRLFATVAEQMPPKHLSRAELCRNYGHALFKLAHHRDRNQHFNAAVAFYKEAHELVPTSHPDQPLTYLRLAETLHVRALLQPDHDDVYDGINLLRAVLRTLPKDNPMFHSVCHALAKMSLVTYVVLEPEAPWLLEDGFRYYEQAASYSRFHSFKSARVALEWVDYAEQRNHASALLAYQTCLRSLNQHLLTAASVKGRRAVLLDQAWAKQTSTLATDAAACAIARGELELAVELSEQGRGLLWSQMAQSRTPLDALRSASDTGRALASDFERVSARLAQSAVAHSEITLAVSRLTTEEAGRRYHQLSKELEDIVGRIRQQDGFQSFLDRPSFQSLQRAALGGPVILVNVSRRRCDALIVLHDLPPRLVSLPDTSLDDLTKLSEDLYHMLKNTTRVGQEKTRERQLVVMLRTLWDTVVRPIVDGLTDFLPRGSRIWWCPTSKLTSLPLHAAGGYRKALPLNLASVYISSYTPTLAALIRARHRPSSSSQKCTPPSFVAIGQAMPSSSTAPKLQTVDAELELVQSLLPPSTRFSALSGEASTADAALEALRTHAWAHLACHGHPKAEQPFDSSFALSDRAVTVLDIVGRHRSAVSLPTGADADADANANANAPEFAFLSACYTTVGDRHAPDEVVHLASAMQFAGFKSVVGTMWAVDDAMAKEMVRAFYAHMFSPVGGDGTSGPRDAGREWDCTEAARALNRASKTVDRGVVTIDQRIVFIHIGA